MTYDRAIPLFFFRHGETFYNAEGRIQGQLDTPLSPLGREQAEEVAPKLAASMGEHGLGFDQAVWVASPLARASETMRIARATLGLAPDGFARDDRLMELGFGRWQDLTWREIDARYPGAVAARNADVWDFQPPDGESYAQLATRVRDFLDGLSAPAVVAAHGGVARALMVLIGGVAPTVAHRAPIHQGRLLVFAEGRGRWT
ncbi:MAG: histidine phosphatase family protein [Rhodoblastus sp.]